MRCPASPSPTSAPRATPRPRPSIRSTGSELNPHLKQSGFTMLKRVNRQTSDDRLQAVLNRLDQHAGQLVYDSETSGLDWRRNHIVGHVVTFGPRADDSCYVPFRHGGGGNIGGHAGPQQTTGWDGELAPGEDELLKRVFRRSRLVVGHNLGFDLKFVYRLIGVQAFDPGFEDTIINEPLIDEFAGKFSLDACCLRRGVQAKKGETLYQHIASKFPGEGILPTAKSAMGHYWRLAGDDKVAVEYAEGDGTSTWQLRDAQMVEIERDVEFAPGKFTNLKKVHDIESRLIRVLARMTCKGIKVDVGYFQELKHKLDIQIRRMLEVFPDPDKASAQAPSDVKWFMEKHNVTDWPMTPKKIG